MKQRTAKSHEGKIHFLFYQSVFGESFIQFFVFHSNGEIYIQREDWYKLKHRTWGQVTVVWNVFSQNRYNSTGKFSFRSLLHDAKYYRCLESPKHDWMGKEYWSTDSDVQPSFLHRVMITTTLCQPGGGGGAHYVSPGGGRGVTPYIVYGTDVPLE